MVTSAASTCPISRRILITGSTGYVGFFFTRALLAQERNDLVELWLLVRPCSDGQPAKKRPELQTIADDSRVKIIDGDLTKSTIVVNKGSKANRNGNEPSDRFELPTKFDAVYHFAASTDFRARAKERTFLVNVGGTQNLLAFLKNRSVGRFYHVSTVFVTGTNESNSVVKETVLPSTTITGSRRHFANPYEESKHTAEHMVAASSLNWVILRIPAVTGVPPKEILTNSNSSPFCQMMTSLWQFKNALRSKYGDDFAVKVGEKTFAFHMVKHNKTQMLSAEELVGLFLKVDKLSPAPKTVLHLVNPSAQDMRTLFCACLAGLGIDVVVRLVDTPRIASPEEKLLQHGLQAYQTYFSEGRPTLDTANLTKCLGQGYCIQGPSTSYLTNLVTHFVQNHLERDVEFGKMEYFDVLSAVRSWGRSPLAFNALDPQVRCLKLTGTSSLAEGIIPVLLGYQCAAVMLGDPLVPKHLLPEAVDTFLGFCESRGLKPQGMQLSRRIADLLSTRGACCCLKFGECAWIDLTTWDARLLGGGFKRLRPRRNAGIRAGIVVEEGSYEAVPWQQIQLVSDEWLSTKYNQAELRFLTRPLNPVDEPGVRKFFAYHRGQLVGFLTCNPLYENGQLVGYSNDLERYLSGLCGIHDLLVLEAIKKFQSEGSIASD